METFSWDKLMGWSWDKLLNHRFQYDHRALQRLGWEILEVPPWLGKPETWLGLTEFWAVPSKSLAWLLKRGL